MASKGPALKPDRRLVDFQAGLIDHQHRAILAVALQIGGDLPGDQVGGFLCLTLALAIEADRILESDSVGDLEMKNGHRFLLRLGQCPAAKCVPEIVKRRVT